MSDLLTDRKELAKLITAEHLRRGCIYEKVTCGAVAEAGYACADAILAEHAAALTAAEARGAARERARMRDGLAPVVIENMTLQAFWLSNEVEDALTQAIRGALDEPTTMEQKSE